MNLCLLVSFATHRGNKFDFFSRDKKENILTCGVQLCNIYITHRNLQRKEIKKNIKKKKKREIKESCDNLIKSSKTFMHGKTSFTLVIPVINQVNDYTKMPFFHN